MSTNYVGGSGVGPSLDNYADGSLQDRYKPQVANVLYQKTGNGYIDAFTLVSTFGPRKAVGGPIIKHQERGFFNAPITVAGSTGAGAAGAPVTVTFQTASLGFNNLFYPQVNDTGFFKNGFSYIITAVSGVGTTTPTITLQPSPTGNVPAFAAGEQIAVIGSAWYEASGQPTAYLQQDWEYQYGLQYFKHSEEISGTAEMAEKWAEVDNLGVSQKGYQFLKIRGEQQMVKEIANEMMFSEGLTTSWTGTPLNYKMQGWKPWITTNGGSVNPTPPGAFSLSQFQGINDDLDAINAGNKYVMVSGNSRQREIVAAASSQFSSNAMTYVKPEEAGSFQSRFTSAIDEQGMKDAALGININIRTFTDGTRTYDFCNLPALSDPSTNNPTGYNSNYLSFILPMNAVSRSSTGAAAPLIEVCYMPQARQKGFMDVWQGGANSEFATTGQDVRYIYYKAHVGQRLACPEQFGIIYAP